MYGKIAVIGVFVFLGIGMGLLRGFLDIEWLWIAQAAFLLTGNIMLVEYAWNLKRKRLFIFPVLGIVMTLVMITANLA